MKEELIKLTLDAVVSAHEAGEIPSVADIEPLIEHPKDKTHGDWATNIAMVLASQAKMPPRKIADSIVGHINDKHHFLSKVEVAGPGFINFYLSDNWYREILKEIKTKGDEFGHFNLGRGKTGQIEFVSANPVGPMHVGHGRWAAVGDALANLMTATGYEVTREFYINDYGNQMKIFGCSVAARYMELLGKKVVFPKDGYHGEYIKEIAQEIIEKEGDKYLSLSEDERGECFKEIAYHQVLAHIKKVLLDMGIKFDVWFSETTLHESGAITEVISELRERGYVYDKDGAVWLKTTAFEDDKDRVLLRENGEPTYFAADIAYHKNKLARGFDKIINIWGADHHGYVQRVKAAIQALGYPKEKLKIIIGQLVNLWQGGELVRMSKRTGEMVTLEELLQEVGSDAARYFFLMRSTDTSLDFDIELAKSQSSDNPVYYVQYAHARICSILKFAKEKGFSLSGTEDANLDLLGNESELNLMRKLAEFEEVVEVCVSRMAPHRLTKYAEETASLFHVFYTKCRVINEDTELSKARLILADCVRQVLSNILNLLGINAPEKM
ncbi:arginine--tRNA ligase [Candidatus Oleimmundimicrobium sp.]|uniref:arginine--tRNA ligase n=1 Tax=Candidatus Oleimmundimicrobium sp. TaxID=3060597 RepID=UPI0027206E23|nr:arginine--tRNA ligase [Candidatus Oleimmundimicrobium sp.]MDO8886418.1 arginine--tRNA ligase [Candidatus Oleimmundimicrobium sp.]